MKIIGLEEHFVIPEVVDAWQKLDPRWRDVALKGASGGEINRRLSDWDGERFAAMDETGMDVQVLTLTAPGLENLEPADAVALQVVANDRLADAVRRHPDRLQGMATLATPAPAEAARELERAVTELGFHGGLLCGRTRERNLDHPDHWAIFEAAAALRAPLYLHPQSPAPAVREAYYGGFSEALDAALATFGIGWHYETGIQLLRLILSGAFDRFPDLQIVTGHWGEVVLFYLDRVDQVAAIGKLPRPISEYVRSHVSVTASGIFSPRYLRWATEVIGIDRVLFSTDYPYRFAPAGGARRFLDEADLTPTDREKVASGNWERLCAAIRR